MEKPGLANLQMNISEMLKYREILEKKRDESRVSGRQPMLSATLKRIDLIDMMLDAALLNTLGEAQSYLLRTVDTNMFDVIALQGVIGPIRFKSLPSQGMLNFEVVEEVTEESKHESIKSELKEILKRNFVQNIPAAVDKYRELTGSKSPNSKVWIEVKEMLPENNLIGGWDRILCKNVIEKGGVYTFCQVKKHLQDWDDVDIAILLNDAVVKAASQQESEKKMEAYKHRAMGVLELGPNNIKDFLEDQITISAVKGFEGVQDIKTVKRRVHQITNVLAPSKRAEILKRREYVEKGY